MQDNEPLMRALSNLICTNNPELVLFVGEALVGNDAVDQLTKFNQRLLDLSNSSKPHAIDGILLTKFDTIDDKVKPFPWRQVYLAAYLPSKLDTEILGVEMDILENSRLDLQFAHVPNLLLSHPSAEQSLLRLTDLSP